MVTLMPTAFQPACTGARILSWFAPVLYQSLRVGTVPRLFTIAWALAGSYGYGSVERLLPGMPTGTMAVGTQRHTLADTC